MAYLGETFTDENNAPKADFQPIPAGKYSAVVDSTELKETKSGGTMLVLTWKITDEKHQNRLVWQRINLRCPKSEKAERIGRQQLAQIRVALGIKSLVDSDQLIGGNALIHVVVKKDDEWGDQNEVKQVKALSSGSPAPMPAAEQTEQSAPWETPAQQAPTPAPGAFAPWAKKG